VIPLELCEVPPGQFVRKHIPQDKTSSILEFSTMSPNERKERIQDGLTVRPRWCAGCAADSGPLGVTIWAVAICSTIRNERFEYAGGPQCPNPQVPDIKIQPSIQATQRRTRCLTFLMAESINVPVFGQGIGTRQWHMELVGHIIN
jgi:hypothetical protein